MAGHTSHTINGTTWYYYRARICDEMNVPLRSMAWFLFGPDREYEGHFQTKHEMLEYINTQ